MDYKFSALITRPAIEGRKLKGKLKQIGIDGMVEPVMRIKFIPKGKKELVTLLKKDIQAIVISSINGAKAIADIADVIKKKSPKILAIGQTTADILKEAGFNNITTCDGTLHAVKDHIIKKLKPKKGLIIHCSGNIVAMDLPSTLASKGYEVKRVVLYHSLPSQQLSEKTVHAIKTGKLKCALFYSSRTALIFNRLAQESNLNKYLDQVHAFCFSSQVASVAREMPWKSINIAKKPDENSLISLVENFRG